MTVPAPRVLRPLVVAAALVACVLVSAPAQAGRSGAQLTDPAGDILVPSLDVTAGVIQLDTAIRTRTLRMTATVNGELTGIPADYDLVTGTRLDRTCYYVAARVRWNGVSVAQAYQHASSVSCDSGPTTAYLAALAVEMADYAAGGDPVDGVAGSRTVGVSLPAPAWLGPGAKAGFAVLSHTPALGVSNSSGLGEVGTFDLAALRGEWRVG